MPYQILDYTVFQKKHVGCEILQREIFEKKPKVVIGGHLHESHGYEEHEGIKFYNVSVLNEHYKLTNEPTIIEV